MNLEINNELYCLNCENQLTICSDSLVSEFYTHCPNCDSLFVLRLQKPKKLHDTVKKSMIEYAKIKKAKLSVTKEDLIKLGRLK